MCLGIPGRLIEPLGEKDGLDFALVEFAGVTREVCTSCVPDAVAGDYVLVHAGLAISRLDSEEADRLIEHLREMGEADAESGP